MDANVVRVLARLRRCSLPGIGPGAVTYQNLATQLLDPQRPGDFNQVLLFQSSFSIVQVLFGSGFAQGPGDCTSQQPHAMRCAAGTDVIWQARILQCLIVATRSHQSKQAA